MRRLLALLVAVLLVGAALWVDRSRGDDGASGGAASGRADGTTPTRLICPTELRVVCEAAAGAAPGLVVRDEPAGTTAERVSAAGFDAGTSSAGDAAGADAWLVPASWLGVVGARRALAGAAAGSAPEGPVLASSPLVTVAWADRWKELGSRCGGSPTWSCLATLAGAGGTPDAVSWPGGLKVGWDPAQEALAGPAVLGQMAVALSGGASVATNDLDDPTLSGPLDALAAARPNPGTAANTPLGQMLTFGRSRFDLVGTVRAALGTAVPPDVVVAPAAPGARLDLVLAALPGRPGVPEARRRALADALLAAGWEAPAPAGAADGLPSGGTLEALRRRWP